MSLFALQQSTGSARLRLALVVVLSKSNARRHSCRCSHAQIAAMSVVLSASTLALVIVLIKAQCEQPETVKPMHPAATNAIKI